MFKIVGDKVYLTRGDSAKFNVPIDVVDDEGKPTETYSLGENDLLVLTLRKTIDSPIVLQKTLVNSSLFSIKPDDTKNLSFGTYIYDVQLTTADGEVYTVAGPSTFDITKEVTY